MTGTSRPSARELREVVRSLTERWQTEGRYQSRSDSWLRSFNTAFTTELAALGLIGMTWPTEHGGGAFSNTDRLAVTEELLRAGAPVAAHWIADRQIGPAILRHGSPHLQREILPGIITGDYLFCLGMSEPDAGSDLAAVRTTATKVDGGWRVSGRKVWTTGAHRATHAYVLARTSRCDRKHQGLSEFIVDMDSDGITVSPIVDMAGEHHFNELVFDNTFVPHDRLLGEEGNGWRQVVEQLSFERGGPERVLSTYPLLAEVLNSADIAWQRGEIELLGELLARLAALRMMAFDVAERVDHALVSVPEAATLKYLGNAFERDIVGFGHHVLGPGGPQSTYGQALLASPGFSLRGGAADVLLSIIIKQETSDEGNRHMPDAELVDLGRSLAGLADDEQWQQTLRLGLVGIGVDENRGGSGGTIDDLATIVAELGAQGISNPLIDASLGFWVLSETAGLDLLANELDYATVGFVDSSREETLESSVATTVPYAAGARLILLVDDRGEVLGIEPNAGTCHLEPRESLAGEPVDFVSIADLGALSRLGHIDATALRARKGLLWSAALCGALEGTYELTRAYTNTREQFGAPLIKIPAVSRQLALMKTHVLLAKAALRRATSICRTTDIDAHVMLDAVGVARITAAGAADEAAQIAHQLHGAIGITAEYGLHRLTRRLWAWRDSDVAVREWLALIGARGLSGGEPFVWDSLSAPSLQLTDLRKGGRIQQEVV